jgi:hypothetical protein
MTCVGPMRNWRTREAPIEQIQISLGHASIQTTERYLAVKQDLGDAPCDHLGLKLNPMTEKGRRTA